MAGLGITVPLLLILTLTSILNGVRAKRVSQSGFHCFHKGGFFVYTLLPNPIASNFFCFIQAIISSIRAFVVSSTFLVNFFSSSIVLILVAG